MSNQSSSLSFLSSLSNAFNHNDLKAATSILRQHDSEMTSLILQGRGNNNPLLYLLDQNNFDNFDCLEFILKFILQKLKTRQRNILFSTDESDDEEVDDENASLLFHEILFDNKNSEGRSCLAVILQKSVGLRVSFRMEAFRILVAHFRSSREFWLGLKDSNNVHGVAPIEQAHSVLKHHLENEEKVKEFWKKSVILFRERFGYIPRRGRSEFGDEKKKSGGCVVQ